MSNERQTLTVKSDTAPGTTILDLHLDLHVDKGWGGPREIHLYTYDGMIILGVLAGCVWTSSEVPIETARLIRDRLNTIIESAARKEAAKTASAWWFDGFVSACAAEKDIPDLLCEIPKHSYNDLLEIQQAATESATKDQGQ